MTDRKRRAHGEGALYRREDDGMWVGSVTLPTPAGQPRKRRVVYATTQEAAVKKLRKLLRERDEDRLARANPTLEAWAEEWLTRIVRKRVKPKTYDGYTFYWRNRIKPYLGSKRLDRLTPPVLRDWHDALLTGDNPLSPTSVLQCHRILGTMLADAYREGLVAEIVTKKMDPPQKAHNPRGALTAAQAIRVLRAAIPDDPDTYDPMTSRWIVGLLTGARQGELLGLRWDRVHLDDDQPILDIYWQLQHVTWQHGCADPAVCRAKLGAGCRSRTVAVPPRIEHDHLEGNAFLLPPKTMKSRRIVPIIPPVVEALRLHRERDTGPNPHNLVWHDPQGRPIWGTYDWKAWRALCDKAGIPQVTIHEQRNTAATLLGELGVDSLVIASILGHTSVDMTNAYRRVRVGVAADAVKQLGELLELSAADA